MKHAFSLASLVLLAACSQSSSSSSKSIFLLSPPAGSTLPDATVNVKYTQAFQLVSGGTPPYSFGGVALPQGMSLATVSGTSFTVSGVTTQPGSGVLTVQVADAAQHVELESYALTIDGTGPPSSSSLTVSPSSIASFTPGQPYDQTFTTTGQPPITWSVTGSLPRGITLQSSASTLDSIAGTPTLPGSYGFTINVQDSTGLTGSLSFNAFVP